MLTLEAITVQREDVVKEMLASNAHASEKVLQAVEGLLHAPLGQEAYFLKADDTYIGLLSYTEKSDRSLQLHFILIHGMYQGYGYGTNAYYMLEMMCREKGIVSIQTEVSEGNEQAQRFVTGLRFSPVEEANLQYWKKQLS